ncbi:MAG: autotransporter-associated beta strand repeat-containing protein [Opitutaceae bacterium]
MQLTTKRIILPCCLISACAAHATEWEWDDGGGNNSWNNSGNWNSGGAGGIPDGNNDDVFFNGNKSLGNKIYVTNEGGDEGTARTVSDFKITGNGTGDNWRIYANSGEVSNSSVSVTVRDSLQTDLSGGSSADLYFTLNIASGRTITWTAANDYMVLHEPLGGSGTLDGDNTAGGGMTLTKNGSFSGTINTGKNTLDIDHTDALDSATINLEDSTTARLDFSDVSIIDIGAIKGSGKLDVGNGKTLEVGNGTAQTFSGVISGNGSITKTGSAIWTLSGASTFNGDITVGSSVGNIKLGAFDTIDNAELILNKNNGLTLNGLNPKLGGLSGSGDLALGSNTLTISGSSSTDYTGVLSGTGGLTVQSGTFLLNSASTYTGSTAVNGGQLHIKTSTQLPSLLNGISMSGGGDLYVAGTQEIAKTTSSSENNRITISDGATLKMGDSSDWTYTGYFSSDYNPSLNNIFRKVGSGKMTLAKGNHLGSSFWGTLYIDAGTLALGNGINSDLTSYGNPTSNDAAAMMNNGTLELNANPDDYRDLRMHISGPGNLVMKSGSYSPRGWNSNDPANNTYTGGTTLEGGTLFISDPSEIGTAPINFAGGILGIEGNNITQATSLNMGWITTGNSDIRIDIDSGGNSFSWDSALSHSGGFEKLGDSTLRFVQDNTYIGDTTISEGRLVIGYGGSTGSVAGDIINHAELVYNRAGSLTQNSNISGDGIITNLGSGNVTLADISDGSGDIQHTGGGALTISSDIGGTRALVHNAGGDLILTGAANHTGGTSTTGAFYIGNGGTTGSHAGNISNDGGVVTFNKSSTDTYPAVISGSGTVTQAGSGTTTFTQHQTYTGATTISDGTLELGNGDSNPTLASSEVINNSNLRFNYASNQNTDFSVSGMGNIEKVNTNKLTLHNDWTHTGTTTVSAGTLTIGNNSTGGWLDTPILNNGIIEFARSDDPTFNKVISGSGLVRQTQNSVLTLTANNTYTGQTAVNSGEIQLGNGGTTGYVAGDIYINSGTIFRLNRSNDFSLPGSITGNGTLIKQNANTVTLPNGITSSNIGTTLSGGTLIVGTGTETGRINGDVSNSSILILNTSGDNSHAGDHIGTGSFTKQGSGTATFSGALDHTGGTTISAGTLELTGTATSTFQNDATFKFSPAIDTVYNQTVTGNGAFIKGGGSTLSFTNNSTTFAGGVTVSGGTLAFGDGGTAGLINQDITNNANLSFNRSNNFTFAKVISGTGNVKQDGTGTTTLTEDHTYTGDTIVNDGTLNILYDGTNGTVAGDITNNSNLQLQSDSGIQVIPGNLDGSGGTTKLGAGTTELTGTTQPSGTLTVSAGTLSIGNGGTAGTLKSAVTTNATLKFNRSNDFNHGYAVDGNGSVDKDGASILTLLTDWTHTGGTTISGGTLRIGNNNAQGSLTGDITNNATLQFNRNDTTTFANTITGTGNVIKLQNTELILTGNFNHTGDMNLSRGTLTVGNNGTTGAINGDIRNYATLQFNRSDDVSYDGVISGTGTLKQISNSTLTLTTDHSYTGNTVVDNGTLKIIHDGNSGTVAGNLITSAALVLDSTGEQLIPGSISGTGSLEKNGSGNTIMTGTTSNSGGISIVAGSLTIGNDGSTGALSQATSVATGATLRFNKSSDHTHTAPLSGAGAFEQAGSGRLYIRGDLTHTGDTTISNGELWIGSDSADGSISGDITNNATLNFNRNDNSTHAGNINGTGAIVKARGGSLSMTGDWTHSGGTTLNQGSLSIGNGGTTGSIIGDIEVSAALKFNRSDDTTHAGLINGSGSVTQDGSNTLTLTAANTYTGNTTINAGTLDFDSDTDHSLSSQTDGVGTFKKSGAGILSTTKNLTHSGGITIANGTLSIGDGSSTPTVSASDITNNAALHFNLSNSLNFARDVSGSGSIEVVDTNIMTVIGDWTHSGGTTVTSGTLRIGNEGTDGSLSGNVINNSTLTFFRNDATTFTGDISGTGNVVSTARNGNLTVTGDWTHDGNTNISRGTLNIGNGGTEGWISGNIVNSANLYINRSDDVTYDSILSGAGKLTKQGAGSLELTAANTMTGATTVEAGTLIVNNTSGVALDGTITVDSGATLTGSGSVGKAVTCLGILAPGNSPGTLTLGGNLNLNSGTYLCEIDGNNNDCIDVGGTLTITTAEIDFDVLAGGLTEDYYIIATYNSLSGSAFATITDLPAGYVLNYSFNDGSGNDKIALVAESSPTLDSIELDALITSPSRLEEIAFDITFSTPVTGVGAADFEIDFAGSHGATTLTGSGANYRLSIANVIGDGTLTLSLKADSGIINGAQIDLEEPTATGSIVIDQTAPVISLIGDSDITLVYKSTWKDPGATATDNVDGSLTVIEGGDTVDTAILTTYTLTYNVIDTAGNPAEQVVRTVTIEEVAPYDTWLENFPSLTGDDTLLAADPDQDGRSNLEEFAFDGDPTNANDGNKSSTAFISAEGSNSFAMTIPVREGALFIGNPLFNATVDGITYTILGSYELNDFTASIGEDSAYEPVGLDTLNEGWSYKTFYLTNPAPDYLLGPKGFLKVEISTP